MSSQVSAETLQAEEDAEKAAAAARAVYGERFADKAKRVQRLSPHGRRPGWAVRPIIVKSGDDCRQVRERILSKLLPLSAFSTCKPLLKYTAPWVRLHHVLSSCTVLCSGCDEALQPDVDLYGIQMHQNLQAPKCKMLSWETLNGKPSADC